MKPFLKGENEMAHNMLVKTKGDEVFSIADGSIIRQIKTKMYTQHAVNAQINVTSSNNIKSINIAPPSRASIFADADRRISVISQDIDVTRMSQEEAEKANILKEHFIKEWCTLITMLALNEEFRYGIKFINNTIPETSDDAFISTFLKEAKAFDEIHETYDIIYKYNSGHDTEHYEVLGATHNKMLVCPSPNMLDIDAAKEIFENLDKLYNEEHGRIVAIWLRELKLRGTGILDSFTLNLIAMFADILGVKHLNLAGTGIFESAGFYNDFDTPNRQNILLDKKLFDDGDIPNEEVWFSFFVALALNDIRGYGMEFRRDGKVVVGNDIIANKDAFTRYSPQEGMFIIEINPVSLSFKNEQKEILDSFELTCLLTWLKKFVENCNSLDAFDESVIINYAKDLITIVEKQLLSIHDIDYREIINKISVTGNRFVGTGGETPFNNTINKNIAAFFCDKNGICGKTIRNQWLNTLSLIALNELREFNIELEGNVIKYNKTTIGLLNSIMLLEPCNEASSLVEKALGKLYEHESLLVAHWFEKLKERINNAEDGAYQEDDVKTIKELIQEYVDELMDANNKDLHYENREALKFLTSNELLYCVKKFSDDIHHPINYIIGDKLLESKLIVFLEDSNVVKSKINDDVYKVIESKLQSEATPKSILLPFSEGMISWMANKIEKIKFGLRKNNLSDFFISSVKTTHDENGYLFELSFSDSLIPFNIKKYYTNNNIETINRSLNGLGSAAVWPDVEIEGFNAYKLTYVKSLGSENMDIDIPDYANPLKEESKTDDPIVFTSESGGIKYELCAYKLKKFPRFVCFKKDKTSGWMLFAPDESINNPDPMNYQKAKGIIGIDLGTSNSLVWTGTVSHDGRKTKKALKFDDADGKVFISPPTEKVSWVFFQTPLDRDEDEKSEIFPTMYTVTNPIKAGNFAEPLINGNICIVPKIIGVSSGDDNKRNNFFKMVRKYLNYNLKWDNMRSHDLDCIFSQLVLSAFISIVKDKDDKGKPMSVDIRISYPGVFGNDERNKYDTAFKKIINMLNTDIEPINKGSKLFTIPRFYTESYCASMASDSCYSGEISRDYGFGLSVIDIGGGTTDVAMAQGDREATDLIKAELSIKFAARDILGSIYLNNGKINFECLCKLIEQEVIKKDKAFGDMESVIDRLREQSGKNISPENLSDASFEFERLLAMFDALPMNKKHGVKGGLGEFIYSDYLTIKIGHHEEALQFNEIPKRNYHIKVKFACAALFFTIGAMLNRLRETRNYNFSIDNIFLAGKGVGVREWLRNLENDETPENYLAKFYFVGQQDAQFDPESIENKHDVSITPSDENMRKHEVASGLVETQSNGFDSPQPASPIKELEKLPHTPDSVNLEIIGLDERMYHMSKKVGLFLRTFKIYSEKEYDILFAKVKDDFYIDDIILDDFGRAEKYISDEIKRGDSTGKNFFPLNDAYEYAVLEFATQIIRNSDVQ